MLSKYGLLDRISQIFQGIGKLRGKEKLDMIKDILKLLSNYVCDSATAN